MTPEEWQRIKATLQGALDLAPGERSPFLDEACANEPELRARIEKFLAAERQMGEFLELSPFPTDGIDAGSPDIEWSGRRVGPYQLLREIGRGGMGTVYLAERADGQYRKRVAIKLVNPHLGAEHILRRFRNERQVVAALEHPNIAQLLDGGVTDVGRPYLVMEYVEGVRIDEFCGSRELPVRERLRMFRDVCAAVQFAHENQVIHRDIKPSNILVTADGAPKLLDFGIAKALNRKPTGETVETLGPGPMTPEYASPEQVQGGHIGPATDIYALGVVLYRLLTGEGPYQFQGRDLRQVARVICEQAPAKPSVAGRNRQLAGDLDNIVLKALRKEPEQRYRSAVELSEDIDRFLCDLPVHACKENLLYRSRKFLKRNRTLMAAIGITAALVLSLVAGLERFQARHAATEAGVKSIAVLPLENLSGDKEQEYFADGITDALISDLARIRTLRVISRTSVMTYKGRRRPLPEIARTLGVDTIAEGSVSRAGNRIRIGIRLVDALKERQVWNGSYEGELKDVLAVQSHVARAVAEEIHLTLDEPERDRTSRVQRVDLGAYEAYLKGQHDYLSEDSPDFIKAAAWFQQAIALDPNYAPAYAGLARCYYQVSNLYYPPSEMMPKVKVAALKAIELDPTLGEAYSMLAFVRTLYDFNRGEAEKGFKRALELRPSDAEAHGWYSSHLITMGRFDEALAEAERAEKLDPTRMRQSVPWVFYYGRRYNEAIQLMQLVMEKHPDFNRRRVLLGMAWEQKNEWVKAIAEMEKALDAGGTKVHDLAWLGYAYAASGRTADAHKILRRMMKESQGRYLPAFGFALLNAGLGKRDEAFRWLQKAYEDHSENFAYIGVDPRFDVLHSDPRWAGVLRNAGLTE